MEGLLSRRDFFSGTLGVAGMAVAVRSYPSWAVLDTMRKTRSVDSAIAWSDGLEAPRFRYEGVSKVTGQKVFGRDFRAKDLGWPGSEVRCLILKADRCDHQFLGFAFDSIPKEFRPWKVITGQDIKSDSLVISDLFGPSLFASVGFPPDFQGQPLALLLFQSSELFLAAESFYHQNESLIIWGKKQDVAIKATYISARYVRYSDSFGNDLYSSYRDAGPIPDTFDARSPEGQKFHNGLSYAKRIQKDIDDKNWHQVRGIFSTQTIDPCFMEPECGLAWYEKSIGTLHVTMGSQSPYTDGQVIATLFSKLDREKMNRISINSCYIGGGFGGKDHSIFPLYLALAAFYSDSRPVRMINSRSDQFQMGLKRHASEIEESLTLDSTGQFQALQARLCYSGGGKKNLSVYVAGVGAQNAASAYYFPCSDVKYLAKKTKGVPSGSMRGFGTVQSIFVLESLIDEAAGKLGFDPIELRLKNILKSGMKSTQGVSADHGLRVGELLEMAQQHRFWKNRDKIKATRNSEKKAYGIGFAAAMKSFGTNMDAILCEVSLDIHGKIQVVSGATDMGNGSATTLSMTTKEALGCHAHHIRLGVTESFDVLGLKESWAHSQEDQDRLAQNSRWVPSISMASAASTSAFHHRHGVQEASRLLLNKGLLPAARDLWGLPGTPHPSDVYWKDGQLCQEGRKALSLPQLSRRLHEAGLVTGVMIHAFYRGGWSYADFEEEELECSNLPIDALAVKKAHGSFEVLERRAVRFPSVAYRHAGVTLYTPCAAIVGVEIDKESGEVRVDRVESFLECGPIVNREIVEGQNDGGVAMAIGQALFEFLPEIEGGAGDGTWNFGRYRIPKYRDIPVTKIRLHTLPPLSQDERSRGMAEVVMVPIAPAIANAVHDATGFRARSLPLRADHIKRAFL